MCPSARRCWTPPGGAKEGKMPAYNWPPMDKRKVIGQRVDRVDALVKATGQAKYPYDVAEPDMLYAALLTCPHAHARIRSMDTSEAQRAEGVTGIEIIAKPGAEIQWAGGEVAVVAAATPD